jgi:hypothetical protein
MLQKSKLEEISAQLPERERRELLAKINRSLADDEGEGYVRVELKQEEREKLLAEEMQYLTLWVRFVLWLRRLFSGRSRKDVFIDLKIKQLKWNIRQRSSGITGFETRNLTPKFARQLFDLYATAYPLREVFQAYHRDPGFRELLLARLVESRLEGGRKELEGFLPVAEMERIFRETGSEEEVRAQLLRRFGDYVRHIPDKVIREVEEGMRPVVYLRNLVLLSYAGIFRHFSYQPPGDILDEKYPYFTNGSVMLMLEPLERLWHALSLAERLGPEWFCHEELFRCYYSQEVFSDEGGVDDQELEMAVSQKRKALAELVEAAVEFFSRIPLVELIRYFRRDPYLRLVSVSPQLQLKTAYTALLKRRILERLSERILEVKKTVIAGRLREIFKTGQLFELFYYPESPGYDYAALGLPYFGYTRSLKIMYNYLARVYRPSIQESVAIANAYVLNGNRIIQARLNQAAAGLEALEARIVLFDRSLAPDEEDGKNLLRIRHHLETDVGQQKLYRGFVSAKDKEARDLIDTGMEHLSGIRRVFDDLLGSPVENIRAALKTLHFYRGRSLTLGSVLKSSVEIIVEFQELMGQLVELEKGS